MEILTDNDYLELELICPGKIFKNVSLADISRWKIGGYADLLVLPESIEQIIKLRTFFFERKIKHVIVGATTNLLFSDSGLKVPCIKIGSGLSGIRIERNRIFSESGVWVPWLARKLMQFGLTGAEHICGIPATLGGLVFMNGGSQRKSISKNIVSVCSVDVSGSMRTRDAESCGFGYRKSIFQNNSEIIVSASMEFDFLCSRKIRKSMLEILADRRGKFPSKLPNCGSVFKSDPVMYSKIGPPGAAIEKVGLKGISLGGAMISDRHANFIVNINSASSNDVIGLINIIKKRVCDETGFELEAEVIYVTPYGEFFHADSPLIKKENNF